MENTKVVVMSAEDVAAMRKAHKEAEIAYHQAKVGSGSCRARQEAGIQYEQVQTTTRHNELKFVRVMQDGSIDPNQIITIVRKQLVYKMRPDASTKTTKR